MNTYQERIARLLRDKADAKAVLVITFTGDGIVNGTIVSDAWKDSAMRAVLTQSTAKVRDIAQAVATTERQIAQN